MVMYPTAVVLQCLLCLVVVAAAQPPSPSSPSLPHTLASTLPLSPSTSQLTPCTLEEAQLLPHTHYGVRVCSLAHAAVQVARCTAWPTGHISKLINWWLSTCALTGCVLLFLPPALPALVPVILPSPASATAGEVVELSCSVPVVEHLVQSPTLDWSEGSVGQPGVAVTDLTTLGGTIWRNISFSPLKTSHGGQYVCQAGLSIPAIGLEETWASSRDLSVQSEWLRCVLCWSVLVLDVCPPHSPQASGDCFWSL